MTETAHGWIDALIAAQRPGHSLDQAFYVHPAVFERDRERILRNHWIMAGHVSQIPEPGDFLLFDVAGESIILVRDAGGAIQGPLQRLPPPRKPGRADACRPDAEHRLPLPRLDVCARRHAAGRTANAGFVPPRGIRAQALRASDRRGI